MAATQRGPGPGDAVTVGTLTIELERGSPVHTVSLSGELGLDEAPTLQAELQRALDSGRAGFEVDLSRLEFIDSTGLACLLRAVRQAEKRGLDPPRFRGATGEVAHLFRLTGLDRVLPAAD